MLCSPIYQLNDKINVYQSNVLRPCERWHPISGGLENNVSGSIVVSLWSWWFGDMILKCNFLVIHVEGTFLFFFLSKYLHVKIEYSCEKERQQKKERERLALILLHVIKDSVVKSYNIKMPPPLICCMIRYYLFYSIKTVVLIHNTYITLHMCDIHIITYIILFFNKVCYLLKWEVLYVLAYILKQLFSDFLLFMFNRITYTWRNRKSHRLWNNHCVLIWSHTWNTFVISPFSAKKNL